MSDIKKIYKEISKLDVGKTKVRNIDKVKLAINKKQLPLRLLLPTTGGDMSFVAIGNMQKMIWTIRDLCLFAPVTAGDGAEQYSEAMVDYLSLYVSAVKQSRNPTNTSNIIGVEGQMTNIPWQNERYWAVDITVTVEEII